MSDEVSEAERSGRGTVVVAMLANAGITVAKAVAFVVTGSTALLAETVHSVADTANQGMLLYGLRRARKVPDPQHPFGYGRERYFWPFVYSMLIFVLGAVVSVWQGVSKLLEPGTVVHPRWAFVVLGVALLMDGGSLLNARRQANRRRRGSYWRFVERSRDPEIPVVLLEDTAGVAGVVLAAAAVGLSVVTGDHVYDAGGSVLIGVLLGVMALTLAREMKSLLIGEPATREQEQLIRAAVSEQHSIEQIVLLRSLYLGPEELLIDLKVRISSDLDADGVARAIDALEQAIRDRVAEATIIAVEPDLPRPDDPDIPPFARPERSP